MKFAYTVFSGKEDNKYYLYDGVSSNIFSISQNVYDNHKDMIDKIIKKENTDDSEINNIKEIIEKKQFMPCPNDDMTYWFDRNEYRKNYQNEVVQLMLGVTEKCNFRCKYCVYGGHYLNERIHSNSDMSYSTMKKAIEFFFSISKAKKKVVNFYGGEPFVNFDVIKEAVKIINKMDSETQILITTNGTLLKEDIAQWFINNKNVYLFVSMAGTPKCHDKLRVFANNTPTYKTISENLEKIKNMNVDEYNERINIIFNLFNETQLIELDEFWNSNPLFNGLKHEPEITFIDCFDDDGEIKKLAQEIQKMYPIKRDEVLETYIKHLKANKKNSLIVKRYDEKFLHIHRRSSINKNIMCGVCRPFVKKIFVSVNGDVHMCENFSYGKKFGNIMETVNINNVDELLDNYAIERNKTCKTCWAQKICSLCFRDIFDRDGSVNYERSNIVCKCQKQLLVETLRDYCYVLENDEKILEHLDEYVVSY